METMLLGLLTEKLIALPFECALQTAQFVMTLGAAGFLPFIQAFMLETTYGLLLTTYCSSLPTHYILLAA